ncbi:hypothetical protein D9M68_919790 [compost metagenome]
MLDQKITPRRVLHIALHIFYDGGAPRSDGGSGNATATRRIIPTQLAGREGQRPVHRLPFGRRMHQLARLVLRITDPDKGMPT